MHAGLILKVETPCVLGAVRGFVKSVVYTLKELILIRNSLVLRHCGGAIAFFYLLSNLDPRYEDHDGISELTIIRLNRASRKFKP